MNVMKKRTLALMLSAALCVGLLAGCGSGNNDPVNTPAAGGSETPSQESTAALSGTVNTNGSTSMESVMGYLTEGFKEVQPGITVNYTGSGSSAGVTGAQDGTCDIGLASRDLKDDETGVKAITVAKDGIAIIVNPNNPVADLSVEQIAQLATGEITNWADVGGTDGQVVFMGREAGSGTRDGFESITGTKDACKYQNELTSTRRGDRRRGLQPQRHRLRLPVRRGRDREGHHRGRRGTHGGDRSGRQLRHPAQLQLHRQ